MTNIKKSSVSFAKLSSLLKWVVIFYVIICFLMWCFQRNLLYFPETDVNAPETYGLHDFADIRLKTSDNLYIQAWYHKAQPGFPTIIYFHGNGGHLGFRANYFNILANKGFGILGLSYRGYGKSEGSPSEQGFYIDARTTMDYAEKVIGLSPQQIIIYGESIGTGVAVQIATEYKSAALVLQSPYTSLEELAADKYYWLPVKYLLKDHFDSLAKISYINTSLLILHGEKDNTIPIHYAKTLFDKALEPKYAIYIPDKGHEDFDHEFLAKSLVEFAEKYGLINLQNRS